MSFVGASGLLQLIQSYRLVWIGGRFSGGKTSFALRIAEEFLQDGLSAAFEYSVHLG